MKKIYLINFILFAGISLKAQQTTFEWAKSIGGYYGSATGTSIAVDASNNVYTTGYFQGRVDFDAGAGIFYLTSDGYYAVFITKTDPSGNFLWAKQLGGNKGNSIIVDGTGNIYVTGSFSGTADFDPGAATYNLTSAGSNDVFIFKSDASGIFLWAKQFGSYGDDAGYSVVIDGSGNVYTAGGFMANVDFDPGPGTYFLNVSIGNVTNTFISKLNYLGNFVWAKQFEGWGNSVTSMTLDAAGNIYTTGRFSFTNDFDPGSGTFNLTASTGSSDIFISSLNFSGNFNWAKAIEGTSAIDANSIAVDGSGNVYTTGDFYGTTDFDPGAGIYNFTPLSFYDMFILKLDFFGNFVWAKQIGGINNSEHGNAIKLDAAGNIYTTGSFGGNTDFDPGPGTFNLTAFYFPDIFVSKLNSSGNFVWAKQMGGLASENGTSIAIDVSGNILTTGNFGGICDFDPDTPLTYNLIALGGNFLFNSKLDSSGNFVWATSAGEGASTYPKATATDLAGNIYTTGYFFGIIDFDPGPGTFFLSTAPTDLKGDVFVTKSDASGNLIWAKQMGGVAEDYPNAIAVDASGNVYTAGDFHGIADFDPGPGIYNLTASSTNSDIFVSKLNASGNFMWATRLGSTAWEDAYSIAIDASGNVFTVGHHFPNFSDQIYINKLDAAGNLMWTKEYGGSLSDQANAIATDITGNIYITGYFSGTADFDPGSGTYNLTSFSNTRDIFVSKLDGSGNFIWAKQMGGSSNDYGSSVLLDALGNIYTTGTFGDTVDFDPGAGTYNLIASNSYGIFVSKLSNSGNFLWAKQFGGVGASENVRSMAMDIQGNIYTTGDFYGTVDFNPGMDTFNLISSGTDIFISKLDVSGNFAWALKLGGTSIDRGYSIATDGSGSVYTTGNFTGTVDFDPASSGTYNLSSIGNPDLFIQKISQCPWANITPTGSASFCSGGNVILNANTGAGFSYQWKKNGNNISGATAATCAAATAGNYSVVVSSQCGVATSPVVVITVNPLPSAAITASGPTTFCSGNNVVLNAPVNANYSYQWNKNGVVIVGATHSNYTATTPSTYKVMVTNNITGCSKTTATGAVVTVNPIPKADISPQGPTTFCAGGSVVLAANTGTGLTYAWKKGYVFISGATLSNYTATTAGTYRVQVTKSNGCSKLSAGTIVSVPCRKGESIPPDSYGEAGGFDVTIFPNPSSGDFVFEIQNAGTEKISICVYDVIGKLILSESIQHSAFIIQHSKLVPGIYSAVITNGENKKVVRLIKAF